MLITCKKGTNETLKNPENAPFLHFFCTFLILFPRISWAVSFFSCIFAAEKK